MTRNIYFDYLRGISAIAVMLYHYTTRFDQLFGHVESYPIDVNYGSYGVLVFFLLSGYLTFKKAEDIKPVAFLKKRFLRLYPSFWVAMIITATLTYFFLPELSVSIKDFFLNLTMIPMYLGAESVDGAYWTMSCELAFYFFICASVVLRFSPKKAIISWLILQIIILCLRDISIFSLISKLNDLLYFHCFMIGGIIVIIEHKALKYREIGGG